MRRRRSAVRRSAGRSSLLVLALLFVLLLTFSIRYRAGSNADRDHRIKKSWHWEVGWTAATLVGFLALFVWGAQLYFDIYGAAHDALPIYVVGQAMDVEGPAPDGRREINELHVPLGTAGAADHDLAGRDPQLLHPGVPHQAGRRPGRYQTLWFQADQARRAIICSAPSICGTDHSRMIGRIVVMEPADYAHWLAQQDVDRHACAAKAPRCFAQLGCSGCHGDAAATVHAPPLDGLYGKPVPLADGSVVIADERYIRDSILLPRAQIVAGYEPIMPSFDGQVTRGRAHSRSSPTSNRWPTESARHERTVTAQLPH